MADKRYHLPKCLAPRVNSVKLEEGLDHQLPYDIIKDGLSSSKSNFLRKRTPFEGVKSQPSMAIQPPKESPLNESCSFKNEVVTALPELKMEESLANGFCFQQPSINPQISFGMYEPYYPAIEKQSPSNQLYSSEEQSEQEASNEDSSEEWKPQPTRSQLREKKPRKDAIIAQKPKPHGQMEPNTDPSVMTYAKMFGIMKYTNMPKKLLKMFRIAQTLKLRALRVLVKAVKADGGNIAPINELTGIVTKAFNKLHQKNIDRANARDMQKIFCGNDRYKMECRRLMKEGLSQLIFQEILTNDNIPPDHKFSYLKCMKTMEWRIRVTDDALVARLQSNFW